MHEPSPAPVVIDCPSCELDFDPVVDPGEAQHLAGVHNELHHGGRREAAAAMVDSDQAAPVAVAGLGWRVSADVYADAQEQAVPFTGDKTATDRAWSFRVDAAVAGMDVLDPSGVDEWMNTHAASAEPHVAEAGLVAAWETHVRGLFDTAVILDAEATGVADDVDSLDDAASWP
jgi:hypothetical protein